MSKIRAIDLLKVNLRLALVQSTWCEGGMQSLGLSYCLLPGLRRIYSSPEKLNQALKRREKPFNTHPFFVGIIAGTVLKIEGERGDTGEATAFSQNAMGPVAALGDPFFLGALPALVAVISSIITMLGGALAGILTFLILFNVVPFFIRLAGVFIGYREGYQVLPKVARWFSPSRTRNARRLAAIGAGVVLVVVARRFGFIGSSWATSLFGIFGMLVALLLTRWRPKYL
jgi:PTS system mannose-specific IID component